MEEDRSEERVMLLLWNRGELSETGREAGRGLRWGLLPACSGWMGSLFASSLCLLSGQSISHFIYSSIHSLICPSNQY